jgi:hypothetical protein
MSVSASFLPARVKVWRGRKGREGCGEQTIRSNPWPNRNISNGHAVTDDVPVRVLGQLGVEDAVEAPGLVDVAVDGVGVFLVGESWYRTEDKRS